MTEMQKPGVSLKLCRHAEQKASVLEILKATDCLEEAIANFALTLHQQRRSNVSSVDLNLASVKPCKIVISLAYPTSESQANHNTTIILHFNLLDEQGGDFKMGAELTINANIVIGQVTQIDQFTEAIACGLGELQNRLGNDGN